MRTQVSQGYRRVLDCVLLKIALDRLQQESCDLLLDQFVLEVLVKAQIGEIATALAMVFHILGVLQHVDHEVNRVLCGHLVVAVEDFRDVGQRGRRI